MRIISFSCVLAAMQALSVSNAAPREESCTRLAGKGPEESVRYLAVSRNSSESNCVAYAVHEVGVRDYAAGAEVLVRYLDYAVPMPPDSGTVTDKYPAIGALFSIGKPAVAPLRAATSREVVPGIARDNAVLTLMFIYRANPAEAVSLLRNASHNALDNTEEENLLRAARFASDKCPVNLTTQCLNGLSK